MTERHDLDEHLENLWHLKEEGGQSLDLLKEQMAGQFDAGLLDELVTNGMVEMGDGGDTVTLSPAGDKAARLLIRSHRLAESLFYTVLGQMFEPLACEFEHMVIPEIVDSLCTLLAHPRECPHGKPIPEGDCCKRALITNENLVVPLTRLRVGQAARVAHVNYKDDQQFHKIDDLHIRRGTSIKLLQVSPAYVIECEGAHIVLDEEIAAKICVFKNFQFLTPIEQPPLIGVKEKNGWGTWMKKLGF